MMLKHEVSMQHETSSDQTLVEKVQQGDKRAFDLLVMKYQYKVMGLIGRYIQDKSEVLDVAQESFIKAYRSINSFRGESAFYTWLYRIAVNTAKNHLVSRSRRPPESDVELDNEEVFSAYESLSDIASPEAKLNSNRLEKAIYHAIEMLPEELRSALTLREFDGLSYEDISLIMECPVGTVRSRIFRAREAVEKHIRPLLDAGESS
ncbi:RNA polymerase sigma factor RpoE [Marinomonas posidonica]|uniref:RNA polymerase sigma factor RpoE n=1 Tax=Marinomonas posidonica TaxID=936476 RepID=UPI0037356BD0